MRQDIVSVGIDIGTSTTQLVFSKIAIENTASSFSIPRIKIVDKKIIYRSKIYFTPLSSRNMIDSRKVRDIVESEYKNAGIKPNEVKTGAVIITGETARKENANQVIQELSGLAGDFVVATAGPDLESIIAGKGAGADKISYDENSVVVNIDIGGGTSNIVVFKDGEVIDTGCLDVGGRLIKVNRDTNKIEYIYDKVKILAKRSGIQIQEGDTADLEVLRKISKEMARILIEAVGMRTRTKDYSLLITNDERGKGIREGYNIQSITFSGGVADYIYNKDYSNPFKYGDIGILLGEALSKSELVNKINVRRAEETIRATVVGAGTHTTEISGSTITYSSEDVFPIKNIPILKVSEAEEMAGFESISSAIRDKIKWFDIDNERQQVAVALKGMKNPSFQDIRKLAVAIEDGMEELISKDYPICIILENDIAKVLGQTIQRNLPRDKKLICIDSIRVENGDYVDIGKPLVNGRVVPVIIKTLVFNS